MQMKETKKKKSNQQNLIMTTQNPYNDNERERGIKERNAPTCKKPTPQHSSKERERKNFSETFHMTLHFKKISHNSTNSSQHHRKQHPQLSLSHPQVPYPFLSLAKSFHLSKQHYATLSTSDTPDSLHS